MLSSRRYPLEFSRVTIDDTRKRDVLLDLLDLDCRLITRLSTGNDHDVASLNFCDAVALIADGLNRHVPNLAFIDWWAR